MSQIATTMPEARYRSTKKRVQAASSLRNSEFSHELKTLQPEQAAEERKSEGKKSSFKITSLWPFAVGIFLTGFAPEWHAMALQAGVWATRFTFPLALLATHREIGIDAQVAPVLQQLALYAQLPLDGLLTMFTLARGKSLNSAVGQLLLVHGVCTFVLWLVSMAH